MSRLLPLAPGSRAPPPPPSRKSNNSSGIRKSTRACDRCREMRKRCDGAKPCASCVAIAAQCQYSGTDGRSREALKSQIEALQQRNAYLERLVEELRPNRVEGAVQQAAPFIDQTIQGEQQRLTQGIGAAKQAGLQVGNSAITSSSSSYTLNSPSLTRTLPETPFSETELKHMFCAATATHPLLGSVETQYERMPGNHFANLPEERITRQALDAFFQCAATLFYVTTAEKSTYLLEKVYHSDNASVQDICELCALAAIGSYYKVEQIPDEARGMYFYLASTNLNEAVEADAIQGMRIFICLCMSSIMDKSSSARMLIISALNLARGKMQTDLQKEFSNDRKEEYRRTLQTLVFLEGWLSYSLGYRNCLKKSEIDLVHFTIPLNETSENASALTTRLIQSQMTKLTIVASGIQDEISSYGPDYWAHADVLSSRLDAWYQSLPPDLHLSALAIPGNNPKQRRMNILQERALYLMHMLYIDMRLQLYCQLLKSSYVIAAEQEEGFLERLFQQIPPQIADAHREFAMQLTRIVSLLFEENAIMTRCWLVICAVFDASVVLLLAACQCYNSSQLTGNVTDMFTHVEKCLTVLAFCSRHDIAANRLRDILEPVFHELSRMSSDPNSLSGSGLGSVSGRSLPAGQGSTSQASATVVDGGEEVRYQHLLDVALPVGSRLVRMTRCLLNLKSPGANVWV
ncbi:hypothetical protein BJX64DRAFT_148626 [Aspergillus heterothallicus]